MIIRLLSSSNGGRTKETTIFTFCYMLKNFLLFSFRLIHRRKLYSIINILGLAVGVAACLLIVRYVSYQKSFDKFFEGWERTYRVTYWRQTSGTNKVNFASACPPAAAAIRKHFPVVEKTARAYRADGIYFHEEVFFSEEHAFWAESGIIDLLGFQLLEGKGENILDEPGKMAVSASTAKKYFGSAPALGQIIKLDNQLEFEVAGVFADRPKNTHFHADILLSFITWEADRIDFFSTSWVTSGFYTYLQLKPGGDYLQVDHGLSGMLEQEIGEYLKENHLEMGFSLQPIGSIHLESSLMQEIGVNGDARIVDILGVVAWVILVIALVNFFNLTSVQYLKRSDEFAIRKALGSNSRNLMTLLLTESLVLNLFALFLAMVFYEIAYPWFSELSGIPETGSVYGRNTLALVLPISLLAGTLSSGLVSGIRLFRQNQTRPGQAQHQWNLSGSLFRKALILFQFLIAITMITGTYFIYRQYQILSNHELGIRLSDLVSFKAPVVFEPVSTQDFQAFRKQLVDIPGIEAVAYTSSIPGKPNIYNRGGIYRLQDDTRDSKNYRIIESDECFLHVYQVKLLEGTWFSGQADLDRNRIVLNLQAMRQMGFHDPKQAMGEKVFFENREVEVGGIISDFHQMAPKYPVEPQIYKYFDTLNLNRSPRNLPGFFTIRLTEPKKAGLIEMVKNAYTSFFPNNVFDYLYLDDYYSLQYEEEVHLGRVMRGFSILAVFLTAMGLFGLSGFTAEQRKKEIAIRKVMGASMYRVTHALLKHYIRLYFLACLFAVPVVYVATRDWLSNYEVQFEPSLLDFGLPLFLVLVFTLSVVFYQSLKTAYRNPSESLRNE
jgi:putative ABC transport system permease protein